jgi:asparagine N-glycosylation enzyme membrane subunit Stt3
MYFSIRKFDYKKLFMVVFALTMLYFSSSLIRLTIVLAPAFAILGALAIVEIITPFSIIMFQRNVGRRRQKSIPKLGKGTSIFLIMAIFVLTVVPFARAVDSAYSPTTLVSSSIPTRQQIGDWTETLQWMKDNLPADTVIAAWWDYGYWISVIAEKISLADNGTINMTQVAQIGKMFMSTENESLPILKSFNADYVLVFTTINQAQSGNYLFGDEVKWRWMAKIGWNNNTMDSALIDTSITSLLGKSWAQQTTDTTLLNWYSQFETYALPKNDTVLTKLMIDGAFPGINASIPELTLQHFQLAFASQRNFVLVYKVIYS